MSNFRRSVSFLAALLVTAVAWGNTNPVRPPDEVVREVANSIVEQLNSRQAEFEAQPELLEEVVRQDLMPALDIEYSARLILGRAGRGATPEQIAAFSQAMSKLLISRYAQGLLEYREREQVEVMPLRGELNEKMTRVRTRVRMTNGRFIPVDYVFRKSDDEWLAFDVIVEGISYVATYRGQIMPQVQEVGIDEVTSRLGSGELQLNEE